MKRMMSLMGLLLLVNACSSYYASNAERGYLKSRSGPMLVVPPSLTTMNLSHFYDLPPQEKDATISLKPPQ